MSRQLSVCFLKILQDSPQYEGKVRIGQSASIYRNNVIKASPFVHAEGKGSILPGVAKSKLHLIAVFKGFGTGEDSFEPVVRRQDVVVLFRPDSG